MKRFLLRERNINYLIFSVVGLCALASFISIVPPDTIAIQGIFYAVLGIILFCLSMFVFASKQEAIIITIGGIVYFLLRFLNLRHPLYLILLIACCISIQIMISKKQS